MECHCEICDKSTKFKSKNIHFESITHIEF